MRYFANWDEALNEIRRDLKELGTRRMTTSVQDKTGFFQTRELANYMYAVMEGANTDIIPQDEYTHAELKERMAGVAVNPGLAWKERPDLWEQYLHGERFAYTYPERMHHDHAWENVLATLMGDHNTRQAYLPIFASRDLMETGGESRIPCSLGYWFHIDNDDRLDVTYLQRSCDYGKHYFDDVWLACRMMFEASLAVNVQPGTFYHWIGSFHVFEDQVADVF